MDQAAIRNEFVQAAKTAAQTFADKHFGGQDGGACGFAWVTIYPEHKGNTKAGREERRIIEQLGMRKDWTGKAYQFWDPAGWPGQSVDVKEAGARAAAEVLKRYGFKAYAGSRLD